MRLLYLEFDADIKDYRKVDSVVIIEQVGIGKVLPGQCDDCFGIVAGLYDRAHAYLCLEREVVGLLSIAQFVRADIAWP